MLFPFWWYDFFIKWKMFDINYWIGGIASVVRYFLYIEFLIPVLLILIIFMISNKNINFKLPTIDIFSKPKLFVPVILSVLTVLLIFNLSNERFSETINQDPKMQKSTKPLTEKYKPPMDFLYIEEYRINSLYSQIEPKIKLKESIIEKSLAESKSLSGGKEEILHGDYSKQTENKRIDQYSINQIQLPLKVIELLNYFENLKRLTEYSTLELSSEKLQQLDDFKSIGEVYKIQINQEQYKIVYDRILRETILEQQKRFRDLRDQIVVKGEFSLKLKEKKITLNHDYLNIDQKNKIVFSIVPIDPNSTCIKSESLKLTKDDQKTAVLRLNVFGKVIRAETVADGLIIHLEPYAMW